MQNSIHIKSLKATLKENTEVFKRVHFQLFIGLLIVCAILFTLLFIQSISPLKIIGCITVIIYLVVKLKTIVHLQSIKKSKKTEQNVY